MNDTLNHNDIEISIAETEEELNQAYRLRYQVFSLEEGDYRYADKEAEVFKDYTDNGKHPIFIAKYNKKIIGTGKVAFRKTEPFLGDEYYHYDLLAEMVGLHVDELMTCVALFERIALDTKYRNNGIATMMLNKMEEYSISQRIKYILIAVKSNKLELINLWKNKGFKVYTVSDYSGIYNFSLMYKEI